MRELQHYADATEGGRREPWGGLPDRAELELQDEVLAVFNRPTKIVDVTELIATDALQETVLTDISDMEFATEMIDVGFPPLPAPASSTPAIKQLLTMYVSRLRGCVSLRVWIFVGAMFGALAGLLVTPTDAPLAHANGSQHPLVALPGVQPPMAPHQKATPNLRLDETAIAQLEHAAAVALVNGDRTRALQHYEMLAHAQPQRKVWAIAKEVLKGWPN